MPAYNRHDTVSYAINWALSRNPAWPDESKAPRGGGDCTNFVSQALYAGGWKMQKTFDFPRAWWARAMSRSERSHSWAIARCFADFLEHSGRAKPCEPADLSAGDVVMYKLPESNHINHVMLVTLIVKGLVHLSYHSNDTLNISLPDCQAKMSSGTKFYYYHLFDSYKENEKKFEDYFIPPT